VIVTGILIKPSAKVGELDLNVQQLLPAGDGAASGFPLVHGPGVDAEVCGEGTDAQAHGLAECLGLGSGPALNSDHPVHPRSSRQGGCRAERNTSLVRPWGLISTSPGRQRPDDTTRSNSQHPCPVCPVGAHPGLPAADRSHPAERHTRREGADHGSETQKHRRAARCGAELPSITSVHDQPRAQVHRVRPVVPCRRIRAGQVRPARRLDPGRPSGQLLPQLPAASRIDPSPPTL
jgi:hypothetical protein